MRVMLLIIALAVASATASVSSAGAQTSAALLPEVRSDTLTLVVRHGPPWAACRRWDSRTGRCLDASWGRRSWRSWYGRGTCRVRGHGWWIDTRGRWRRC
jgi:hypothetical protein